MAQRPNIVFVFADQLHGFALGCLGDPNVQTPHLDALAARGTLFRDTYSCAPICSPFRGALFTGRYAAQTGMQHNGTRFPPGERTLAAALRDGGYLTSYVGKWHLGGHGNTAVAPEHRGGFEAFLGYQAYNDYWKQVWFFDEQGDRITCDRHRTDATTDMAIARIDQAAQRAPFALFVSYQNPHYPEQPAPDFEAMYWGRPMTLRPNADPTVDPYTATWHPNTRHAPEADPVNRKYAGSLEKYLRLYYAMVTQLDQEVGRLLAHLEARGILDNTLFIFTSDHGDMQGSHGLLNKGTYHEESSRIPFIVAGPGVRAGAVVTEPVSSIDFYPTLLAWAGCAPEPRAEGVNLVPLASGESLQRGAPVMVEDLIDRRWAMRDGRWKLVVEQAGGAVVALFDLETDPFEMSNRKDDPDLAPLRDEMAQRVQRWVAQAMSRANPARDTIKP